MIRSQTKVKQFIRLYKGRICGLTVGGATMKTKVIFRIFPESDQYSSEVIALFPDEQYTTDKPDLIMSYMHIGQHGGACKSFIDDLEPANKAQYTPLYDELTNHFEYELEVLK